METWSDKGSGYGSDGGFGLVDKSTTREVPFSDDGRGSTIVGGGVFPNDYFGYTLELLGKVFIDSKGYSNSDVVVF